MSDDLSDEDKKLFRESVGEVKKPAQDRVKAHKLKPKPIVRHHQEEEVPIDDFSETFAAEYVDGDTVLKFSKSGVPELLLRRLRQGKLPVDATVDLHGLYVEQASELLRRFLVSSQEGGARVVLIIHGKGRGEAILKNRVNAWLQTSSRVLAFHSAPTKLGGTGAVLVYLKRVK